MTGGDVIDSLLAMRVHDRDENDTVIRFWGEVLRGHKPDAEWRPISPAEERVIRADLELVARTVRVLLAALNDAKARKPAHVYAVSEGGR